MSANFGRIKTINKFDWLDNFRERETSINNPNFGFETKIGLELSTA
jgi:hypothetical protein